MFSYPEYKITILPLMTIFKLWLGTMLIQLLEEVLTLPLLHPPNGGGMTLTNKDALAPIRVNNNHGMLLCITKE